MRKTISRLFNGLVLLLIVGCSTHSSAGNTRAKPIDALSLNPLEKKVRFAVVGDYGTGSQAEAQVAAMVASWKPDFIITAGDNNYPLGAASTIDSHIGQDYHAFISPYQGKFGSGAAQENRFFPAMGNHDWYTRGAQPYLNYFSLPGNERYYDFNWGPVELFALDSDPHEPDGTGINSVQATWLKEELAKSKAAWKIVYFHHPAYSSGQHGSSQWMQWPFHEWGANAVLSGHDHIYERLQVDGIPYFVDGLGGDGQYKFIHILKESQVRYNADYGAMLVEATSDTITFQFINRKGEVIDTDTLSTKSNS